MPKMIVVAKDHRLKGIFSQRQKAFALLPEPENLELGRETLDYAMPCNYANFCRVLREQNRVWVEDGWAFWLTELNEEIKV